MSLLPLIIFSLGLIHASFSASVAQPAYFKTNCYLAANGSCECKAAGSDEITRFDAKCEDFTRVKKEVRPSLNVRDPVREKAQANYALVLDELRAKFKGLKEGCFPRPKGCLCSIGKTPEDRDITERMMKDEDCKCKEGEKGPGCPAA